MSQINWPTQKVPILLLERHAKCLKRGVQSLMHKHMEDMQTSILPIIKIPTLDTPEDDFDIDGENFSMNYLKVGACRHRLNLATNI